MPKFEGYSRPTYTMVPDQLFDEQLPDLSGAELKVLLYIIRRTLGFKKDADNISLAQICTGITARDGRVLDRGTGLNKDTVAKAVKSLEENGYIIRERRRSDEKGDEPTTYRLHVNPVSEDPTPPPDQTRHPRVGRSDTQETVKQETVKQETDGRDSSNVRKTSTLHNKDVWDEARLTLVEYVEDLANEFLDTASGKASTTRAVNLFYKAGVPLDDFITAMTEARAITKQYTATIKRRNQDGDKTKMAYFFSVLEDRLGLKEYQEEPDQESASYR